MRLALIFAIGFTGVACSSNGLNTGNNDGGHDLAGSGSGDMAGGGGNDLSVPAMCDPVKQNCPSSAPKCELVITGMGMGAMVTTMCTADGTVAEGQVCTIDMTTGADNCMHGLRCTARGDAAGMTVCRKYCGADGDCTGGDLCNTVVNGGGGTTIKAGQCIPSCTMYSTTCGTGATCASSLTDISSTMAMRKSFLGCRPVGTVPVGGTCMTSTDCIDNSVCARAAAGGRACAALCDNNNACPQPTNPDAGTLSCNPTNGLPNLGGICQ